jgi:hypothetical protein
MSSGHDSVFQRNRRLAAYILDGDVGENVLDELLPTGSAHAYEKSLWDYKRELPCLPDGRRPSDALLCSRIICAPAAVKPSASRWSEAIAKLWFLVEMPTDWHSRSVDPDGYSSYDLVPGWQFEQIELTIKSFQVDRPHLVIVEGTQNGRRD